MGGNAFVSTSSKAAVQDAAQTVPAVANHHHHTAAHSAASSTVQQQPSHTPVVAAPSGGSDSSAICPAAVDRPAKQPVHLPVELDSAIQRALKSLTDPSPPRPLLAPEQTPAAVQQQHQRQLDADRCAVAPLWAWLVFCCRTTCAHVNHQTPTYIVPAPACGLVCTCLLVSAIGAQSIPHLRQMCCVTGTGYFTDCVDSMPLLLCLLTGLQCSCLAAGLTTQQPYSACRGQQQ
jgi:hypothetical protein